MPTRKENVVVLRPLQIQQLRSLFGSPKRAMDTLGLTGYIPEAVFYRALRGGRISVKIEMEISEALETWKRRFLKKEAENMKSFALPPYRPSDDSAWMAEVLELPYDKWTV